MKSLMSLLLVLALMPGCSEKVMDEPQGKSAQEINHQMVMKPIGWVRAHGEQKILEILPEFAPALEGLNDFSHLWVLYWFHENDRPEERRTLKVHPRRDPANPLTGVFATRAPVRPNLIGLSTCRLLKIKGNILEVSDLDARDGSPILDLKPYIPLGDSIPEAAVPEWVKRLPHK